MMSCDEKRRVDVSRISGWKRGREREEGRRRRGGRRRGKGRGFILWRIHPEGRRTGGENTSLK